MKLAYLEDGFYPAGPGHIRCGLCGKLLRSNAYARASHKRSAQHNMAELNRSAYLKRAEEARRKKQEGKA